MKETYFKLSKVDPFSGIVEGIATAEEVDHDNEVLDYAASKPYFVAWSNSVQRDSRGKSYGNIRFQHDDKRPVGRLIQPLKFDDANKQIKIVAQIDEQEARNLLQTGTMTGFSIGGRFVKKTPLHNGVTSYVADPCEISIVDRPCLPSATFAVIHSDGTTELRKFAARTDNKAILGGRPGSLDPVRVAKAPRPLKRFSKRRISPNQLKALIDSLTKR
jgi:hypothetical protein